MNFKKLIVSAALIACVGSVFAQGFGGQGRGGGMMRMGGRMATPAMLLGRQDVQTELKLSDDQKTKLGAIQEKTRDKMREAFQAAMQGGERPDPQKMTEIMTKMNSETQKEIDAVLTPDQAKRVRELAIQRGGNSAAMMPDVQKELGITDDQKSKLAALQKASGEAAQALMEKVRSGELQFTEVREKMEANNKVLDAEIGKVLTDDQKNKLKEMGGKPFEFKDEPRGGGR